jgi:hypothetical protein
MKIKKLHAERPKRVAALTRQFQDELLIYHLQTHRAHCLNQSAARVWLACDGVTSVSEIVKCLSASRGLNEAVIHVALAKLETAGLLQESEGLFQR